MSTSDADEAIRQAFELSTKALRNGGELDISDESVQMLLTIGAKALARKFTDEDRYFPPFVQGEIITATEAVVTITEFMHAADLNTFDLGMWMSRPRPTQGMIAKNSLNSIICMRAHGPLSEPLFGLVR